MKLKITVTNKQYKDIPDSKVTAVLDVSTEMSVAQLDSILQRIIMPVYVRLTKKKLDFLYIYTDLILDSGIIKYGGLCISGEAIRTMITSFKAITHYTASRIIYTIVHVTENSI